MGTFAVLALNLAVLTAPATLEPQGAMVTLRPVEAEIISRTNAERSRHGQAPLLADMKLLASARQHAIWMTRNRRMQHTSAAVAENIAMGQNSTAQVVRDWMNSPGHRANILNPQYRRIGVAAYRGTDGTIYWCQQFLR
jgi:uncharacterized protein YkwD